MDLSKLSKLRTKLTVFEHLSEKVMDEAQGNLEEEENIELLSDLLDKIESRIKDKLKDMEMKLLNTN